MSYIFYFHELTQDIILLKTFKQLSIKKYAGMMISTTIIWLYTKSCMPLNQFPLKQLLSKKNPYLFQSPLFSSLLILHFRDQLFSWGVYFLECLVYFWEIYHQNFRMSYKILRSTCFNAHHNFQKLFPHHVHNSTCYVEFCTTF